MPAYTPHLNRSTSFSVLCRPSGQVSRVSGRREERQRVFKTKICGFYVEGDLFPEASPFAEVAAQGVQIAPLPMEHMSFN